MRAKLLPRFPDFVPVEIDHGPHVESLISGFAPYSDFNFVSIWSWNRGEPGGLATLNDNLVIRWKDIVTHELFLTFIGRNRVLQTAETLIDYAIASGIDPTLQAVPEEVFESVQLDDRLIVEYDSINSDYLLSTSEWSTLPGHKFKNKRNAIHRLEREHAPEVRELDLTDAATQSEILRVFRTWAGQRQRSLETTIGEYTAIENLLYLTSREPCNRMYGIGVFDAGRMIGFNLAESLPDGYAIGHFAKADYNYDGVYPFMLRQVCQYFHDNGMEFLNIEVDLGDPGLIISKRLSHPAGRLNRYTISRRENSDLDRSV
ncbi:MAG: DUF2156 domain-containing protein [Thermomicrobiales bacterium]|nr:DUF2156 domain-containing protein [Thermomicrobiales bacterium]